MWLDFLFCSKSRTFTLWFLFGIANCQHYYSPLLGSLLVKRRDTFECKCCDTMTVHLMPKAVLAKGLRAEYSRQKQDWYLPTEIVDNMKFHHPTQNSTWFKIYELFICGIFPFNILCQFLLVLNTTKGETAE